MTQQELDAIIEKHQHWLKEDCEGWEDMRADLRGADLCGADLGRANLGIACLRGANLRDADLREDVELYVHWLNEEHKADIEELNGNTGRKWKRRLCGWLKKKNREIEALKAKIRELGGDA